MNKYANSSSVHGAGRIEKRRNLHKSHHYFIILHHFFEACSVMTALHNRLNRLMDRTEKEKPEDGALMDKANPHPPLVSHKSDSTPQGGKTGRRVRSTEGAGVD